MIKHKILIVGLLLFMRSGVAFAQRDSVALQEIRNYVRYVDAIKETQFIVNAISEGTIISKGKTIGGFSTTILRKIEGDSVYRIQYHDNVGVNTYKTYYFKSGELVYAILELTTTRSGLKSLYKKKNSTIGEP